MLSGMSAWGHECLDGMGIWVVWVFGWYGCLDDIGVWVT